MRQDSTVLLIQGANKHKVEAQPLKTMVVTASIPLQNYSKHTTSKEMVARATSVQRYYRYGSWTD